MNRILCVWIPHWPLQRLAAARAELSTRAVGLYQWQAGGSARVVAYAPCLAQAGALATAAPGERASGIRPGMPLAEATALAAASQTAHGAVWELHDPLADRLAIEELAGWCACFSPTVALEETDVPDSLLLDITGLGELAHGEQALAAHVAWAFAERRLTVRIAVAATPGAAWAVAHFASHCNAPASLPSPLAASGEPGQVNDASLFTTTHDRLPSPLAASDNSSLPSPLAGEGSGVRGLAGALLQPLVISSTQTWPALAGLPLAALQLPPETLELLATLGLQRIEQVAALPRTTLLARFGPLVLERLDRATGAAPAALAAYRAAPELEFEWPFEYPTTRPEMIDFAIAQLLARACQALEAQRRGMLRLECRFACEQPPHNELTSVGRARLPPSHNCDTDDQQASGRQRASGRESESPAEPESTSTPWLGGNLAKKPEDGHRVLISLYRPSVSQRHLGELVRLKCESLRFRQPVVAIRLAVLAADRLDLRQQEMFAPSQRDAPRELANLIDRLSNRLGPQAVVRPWLLANAQPEYACQDQPLAVLSRASASRAAVRRKPARGKASAASASQSQAAQPQAAQALPAVAPFLTRPLHLEPRPRRLAVLSVAPEGPPVRFSLAGPLAEVAERVVRVWGPERIETSWWRTRCVRRDYYQVETASGARYWLFRELNTGHWFLHGAFA